VTHERSDRTDTRERRIAVLSAFPAELAPLLECAAVEDTVAVGDRMFRVGTLAGAPVVLGLTGIGLVNATHTTRAVLEQYDVSGIAVSGVAGTPRRIGDVDVPVAWMLEGASERWPADPRWLALARELEAPGAVALERWTTVLSGGSEERVCVSHEPAVAVGGVGRSGDPFDGKALPCNPEGDEVSGCDVEGPGAATRPQVDPRKMKPIAPASDAADATVDMETAAIGREAAARGLPYIAFRAGSDGGGDPLGLPGFPAQFYAYYRLAAKNAALATVAFIERLGRAREPDR